MNAITPIIILLVVTMDAAIFNNNNPAFSTQCMNVFIRFLNETAILSLYRIRRLVFPVAAQRVRSEVRTEFLYTDVN